MKKSLGIWKLYIKNYFYWKKIMIKIIKNNYHSSSINKLVSSLKENYVLYLIDFFIFFT
jgi:hypothetical protein